MVNVYTFPQTKLEKTQPHHPKLLFIFYQIRLVEKEYSSKEPIRNNTRLPFHQGTPDFSGSAIPFMTHSMSRIGRASN